MIILSIVTIVYLSINTTMLLDQIIAVTDHGRFIVVDLLSMCLEVCSISI